MFVIHNYKRQYGISFRSTCYLRFVSAVRLFDFVSLSFPGIFCRPKATRIPYFRGPRKITRKPTKTPKMPSFRFVMRFSVFIIVTIIRPPVLSEDERAAAALLFHRSVRFRHRDLNLPVVYAKVPKTTRFRLCGTSGCFVETRLSVENPRGTISRYSSCADLPVRIRFDGKSARSVWTQTRRTRNNIINNSLTIRRTARGVG